MDVEITDKQRHDVAQKLRVIACTPDEIGITEHAVIRDLGISAGIYDDCCRSEDVLAVADLIDRPTCKLVQMDATGRPPFYTGGIALNYVVGGCGECGYPFGNGNSIIGNPFSAPNYCPNCGAEVLND